MISFFRKIRRQLANENNFSKYARYAIGEIALVVLGILIALQINNWNEARNESILELNYLESILGDLKTDIKYYDQRLTRDQITLDYYYEYLHKIYDIQESFDEFTELHRRLSFPSQHLTIQNFTYDELVNSGALNIIKNQVLKDSVVSLYKATEEAAKHIQEFNEFSAQNLLLIKNLPDLDFAIWNQSWEKDLFDEDYMTKDIVWKYINDPYSNEFKTIINVVRLYHVKLKTFDAYFKNLKAKSIEMVNMIQQELDKRK